MHYIALLRAINVGGHNVSMEKLRGLFIDLGLDNVRSYIQTGNVFFLEGIGFFRLNQQGKIELEREFFDLDYFLAELQK